MKSVTSHSVVETEKIARDWLANISVATNSNSKAVNSKTATVVGLSGNLGLGKTTFVQAVARALGIKENVTSPTFVIMKNYELVSAKQKTSTRFKKLVHIDAYRLEKGEDLAALSFKEVISDPNSLVLIEWAENVKNGLPANTQMINFEYVSENERMIKF